MDNRQVGEGELLPAVVLHGELVDQHHGDPLEKLIAAWLASNRRRSENTRDAYRRDVTDFADFCSAKGWNPLQLTWVHVDAYSSWLGTPEPDTEPYAESTIARKLSAISSWYRWLVKAGLARDNPVQLVDRPRVRPDDSAVTTLSLEEGQRWVAAATPDRHLDDTLAEALAWLMATLGPRVTEVCGTQIAALGAEGGHRTITFVIKGRKKLKRAVPPDLAVRLDAHHAHRAAHAGVDVADLAGPLLAHVDGRPLDRFEVTRFVRRVARRAGIDAWAKVTPHSLRHLYAAAARAEGATLEEQQESLGHEDPKTTMRYNQRAGRLERDPSYLVVRWLGTR